MSSDVPRHASLQAVQRTAPAKVNLSLRVTGRRADGYHELDGLIAFAEIGDRVTVLPADTLTLEVTGPFADALDPGPGNLVLRAARGLAAAAGIDAGAHLVLEKQLPVAAGLGGGSADAAAALGALAELWNVALAPDRLDALALELGADVPVCRYGRAAFISGIGEVIGPAPPLPPAWLVLANPGQALATAEVFRARAGATVSPPTARWQTSPADAGELAARLRLESNDLEIPARRLAPEIGDVLTALEARPGCLLARMSGSGATCFGLFAEPAGATAAAAQLGAEHPGWWVRAARLTS